MKVRFDQHRLHKGRAWPPALVLLLCTVAAAWAGSCGGGQDVSNPQPDWPQDSVLEADSVTVYYDDEDLEAARQDDDDLEDSASLDESEDEGDKAGGTLDEEFAEVTGALVGDPARLLGPSRLLSQDANGLFRPVLVLIEKMVSRARRIETEVDPETGEPIRGVWRASGEEHSLELELSRSSSASNRWNYSFVIERNSGVFPFLEGFFAFEGRSLDGRQLGLGQIRINYDALGVASGSLKRGLGAFSFRLGPERRSVSVVLNGYRLRPSGNAINAFVQWTRNDDGSGLMRFNSRLDYVPAQPGREHVRQSIAWDEQGRGRAIASIQSENGIAQFVVEECWDAARLQVWSRSTPESPEFATDGDEMDCPTPEALGLLSENPVDPDALPEIPP